MKRLKTHRGHPDFTTRVVRPKISIITTVYNILPAIFRQCFESVLKQASLYWELTLCDDASTNAGTLEVLSHFQGFDSRIQVVRNSRNLHIADSSNRAVYIGTKEFVALSAPEL